MYVISFVFLTTFIALVSADVGLIVSTRSGSIRGIRSIGKTRSFKVFYSVPYAEPPVGGLRYQPPVPIKPWTGIRNGTVPPPVCTQPVDYTQINSPSMGEEDCLYLNIYVPNVLAKGTKKIPVIIYIHGGGFQSGSGNYHPGDFFMDKNVILVSINYRLGSFGFLSFNDDIISGNFGMKDQALALKWIKENIAAFEGDPDSITLMGESAGSASVHAHMFSPLSKGLFHRAIMESGSSFSPWAYYDESRSNALATTFTTVAGCHYKDHAKVLKCLQRLRSEDLIKVETKLYTWDIDPVCLFKISIESNVKNNPFLPGKPSKNNYVTKNIPWITGINSAEGVFKMLRYLANNQTLLKIINTDRKRLLPLVNQYSFTTDFELIDNITDKIIDYYFGKKEIGSSTTLEFVQMMSDNYFLYPMMKGVMTSNGPRYAYFYDHTPSSKAAVNLNLGADHSDELTLLFGNEETQKAWTAQDKRVSAEMIQFWANFATYSDPNGNSTAKVWKPVTTNNIEYLHIRSDSSAMETNYLKERYNFWDSLPLGRKI